MAVDTLLLPVLPVRRNNGKAVRDVQYLHHLGFLFVPGDDPELPVYKKSLITRRG